MEIKLSETYSNKFRTLSETLFQRVPYFTFVYACILHSTTQGHLLLNPSCGHGNCCTINPCSNFDQNPLAYDALVSDCCFSRRSVPPKVHYKYMKECSLSLWGFHHDFSIFKWSMSLTSTRRRHTLWLQRLTKFLYLQASHIDSNSNSIYTRWNEVGELFCLILQLNIYT